MLFIASIPLPTLIRREIERQLTYQPELETKNRKPLLRASTDRGLNPPTENTTCC